MALVVATGIAADGSERSLAPMSATARTRRFGGVLARLKQRGLTGVRLVISPTSIPGSWPR